MKRSKKFITLISLLPIFAIIVGFTYYYFNSTLEKMKNQAQILLVVQNLKLANQEIENVFKLKLNYLNYDLIVDKLGDFEKNLYTLENDKKLSLKLLNKNIDKKLSHLSKIYADRKNNIEKYKSTTAVVNNSIRYIFDLHNNLHNFMFKVDDKKLNSIMQISNNVIALFTFANFDKKINIDRLKEVVLSINNEFKQDSEIYEIVEALKLHSNLIIENAKVIQDIYKQDSQLEMRENIDNLYQLLINYFRDNGIWQGIINNILFVLVFVLLISVTIIFIKEEKLKRKIQELNLSLEERIREEIQKQKEKDEIILQQTKVTAMGEMARNIAHQWRQPLNATALILQDIYVSYEDGELDLEYIQRSEKDAMKQIQFMSQTIDSFRTLFESSEGVNEFNLEVTINKTMNFLNASMQSHSIQIKKNLIDDIIVCGSPDEFSQVVLNILNNAKDALIEKNILNAKIEIDVSKDENSTTIIFKDNAGGIDKEIIDKIFEPYFTTRDQGKGVGMGLYMSKVIVEKNMKGKLLVTNSDEGAEFKIVLPIIKKND